jgi:hypothetical protein
MEVQSRLTGMTSDLFSEVRRRTAIERPKAKDPDAIVPGHMNVMNENAEMEAEFRRRDRRKEAAERQLRGLREAELPAPPGMGDNQ